VLSVIAQEVDCGHLAAVLEGVGMRRQVEQVVLVCAEEPIELPEGVIACGKAPLKWARKSIAVDAVGLGRIRELDYQAPERVLMIGLPGFLFTLRMSL
jgi:hypothetical protein